MFHLDSNGQLVYKVFDLNVEIMHLFYCFQNRQIPSLASHEEETQYEFETID